MLALSALDNVKVATNMLSQFIGASDWDKHHWTENGRLAPLLSIVSYVPLSDSSRQTISLLSEVNTRHRSQNQENEE
jgi:hypothetical protein